MRVGIVVPAWNAATWIGGCVGSVLAQTHRDWTAIVVDDGSTDGTAALVPTDPRVRVLRQENAGVSAARNAGHAALPGVDAVLFLDADDRLAPDALARLAHGLVQAPAHVAASVGRYTVEGENGARRAARAISVPPADPLAWVLRRNPFVNGGHVLVRAAAAAAAGPFRRDLRFGEDWEFWVRLALVGGFVAVPGAAPVLITRARAAGAYQSLVRDPDSVTRCLDALFADPRVRARLGGTLEWRRALTVREMDWTVGRELFRAGERGQARRALRRSVAGTPSLKRVAVALACHVPLLWPVRLRGPFAPAAASKPEHVVDPRGPARDHRQPVEAEGDPGGVGHPG